MRCSLLLLLFFASLAIGLACGGDDTRRPTTPEGWRNARAELNRTVWADDRLADEYEETLIVLWDDLLRAERSGQAGGKAEVLAGLDFETMRVGRPRKLEDLAHGIERFEFAEPARELSRSAWAEWIAELRRRRLRLVQSEWQHAHFWPPSGDTPARSQVEVVLHLLGASPERRLVVEGFVDVEWSTERDDEQRPIPKTIDTLGLRMSKRAGPAAFERLHTHQQPRKAGGLSPLLPVLVYDLDGDGLSEIVLVQGARVLWNKGGGKFRQAPLLRDAGSASETRLTETGVIADLNGDRYPDLLSTRARGDLVVYFGDERGWFTGPPQASPRFETALRAPASIALGDVDGDGDLDAWVAQYRQPYIGGQMPTPYYDANDGHPSYLLLNDGAGTFSDATEAAGLTEKRFRRTYASSFVDLDHDRDLDLLVISDFAGIDLYHNDGRGHFSDANDTVRGDRHLFGMSASFADYDLDGRLDFFVAGMASTAARRLEGLGLGRSERPEMQRHRARMAFGNRMYLARDDGWHEPEFAAEVARTGWTWGTTAFDFDNDGDRDLFAANGHVSGQSVRDFCTNFWRHDIYDGRSEADEGLGLLFQENLKPVASGRESWQGHQKNHLLMNLGGRGFTNVAFLMGVADAFDSRSAVAEDLDLDGRVDLVVLEDHGLQGQRLHIYRNRLETGHHWIGVQLREQGRGISPLGAEVVVRTQKRAHVAQVMTGESVMAQHSTTLHFGLGAEESVEAIEVRWPGGAHRTLRAPAIDRYHFVDARADDD